MQSTRVVITGMGVLAPNAHGLKAFTELKNFVIKVSENNSEFAEKRLEAEQRIEVVSKDFKLVHNKEQK